MKKPTSWNWCHKSKQLVDVDGISDGSEVTCWGCKRRFVVTYFENGKWALVPLESRFQGEARQRSKATRPKKKGAK